jgi:hypothetical protein
VIVINVLRVYKMVDVERAVHAELERQSRLEGEWFPADLLPLVDRFFAVALDVDFQRAQNRHATTTAKAEARRLRKLERHAAKREEGVRGGR